MSFLFIALVVVLAIIVTVVLFNIVSGNARKNDKPKLELMEW